MPDPRIPLPATGLSTSSSAGRDPSLLILDYSYDSDDYEDDCDDYADDCDDHADDCDDCSTSYILSQVGFTTQNLETLETGATKQQPGPKPTQNPGPTPTMPPVDCNSRDDVSDEWFHVCCIIA